MTENDSQFQLMDVELLDIEPVLRQILGDHVAVENFTTEYLLPPGENYGSTILRVHVNLKNTETGKCQDLHLVAKMCPPTEFQRKMFNSARTFAKEIFMYDTIKPAFLKLQTECGLRKDELFDAFPQFYGSRLSLRPDGEFDDNAVILMQNLKVDGYYNGERSIGYDVEHAKMAIKALARFHALGLAMKQKKPGIFEVFKMNAKMSHMEGDIIKLLGLALEQIKEDPETASYYERCNKILTDPKIQDLWSDAPQEPWMTIIHTDFWVNNVMFHRGENDQIDDVKFVDFQIYLYGNPLRDLIFFVYSSVVSDITEEQIDKFFDLYYETLLNFLKKMGCNTDIFSKENFQQGLAKVAPYEFVHLAFMIKMLTLDTKNFNYDQLAIMVAKDQSNTLYADRMRKVVTSFVNRNWI